MGPLSPQLHRTLIAVAETVLPAGRFIPAAGEATVQKVEEFAGTLPNAVQTGLAGLLRGLDAQAWTRGRRSFAHATPEQRLAILERWRTGHPLRRHALR